MVKFHELLDLQSKVEEEKKWSEESQYNVPKGCKKIYEKKLNTFKEKLLNGTDNTCVNMKTPNVLKLPSLRVIDGSIYQYFKFLLIC